MKQDDGIEMIEDLEWLNERSISPYADREIKSSLIAPLCTLVYLELTLCDMSFTVWAHRLSASIRSLDSLDTLLRDLVCFPILIWLRRSWP